MQQAYVETALRWEKDVVCRRSPLKMTNLSQLLDSVESLNIFASFPASFWDAPDFGDSLHILTVGHVRGISTLCFYF